ncbi:site-specific integrase [Flavivirga aquimarina]|uniref:Site-specific integrase n=1 Tax=Flavivirga aquimarina TaxID=2027862 RepID=A0ABT8WB19_9FLAO|nr:site-specific integrase [Flavivirga aquimarina]MDO5970310.1 site-specific integrase [Flavivirga aquimarina]
MKKRGRKFHFQKRVPKDFQKLFSKDVIQIPLGTDSEVVALQRASNFNLILEDFWKGLIDFSEDVIDQKFHDVVVRAKMCGFQYLPKKELIQEAPLPEFVNRLNSADAVADKHIKEAILGGVEVSSITLSKARKEYFQYEEGNLKALSENQIRKWRNPRKRAVKNFIKVIGDKPVTEITRKDVLDFRSWWISRIEKKGLAANSANKEFGFVKKIIGTAIDNHSLSIPIDTIFKGIALKKVEKTTRHPFSNTFIKDVLLRTKEYGLNEEAQLLIFAMTDTGARIGELTGLEEEDIFLDATIPHIKIRPNQTRVLKTVQSERDLPLVGASLYAFKTLDGSFKCYFGKPDLISSTINKFYRENNLFPSKHHSLYSLRHSFEDRLTAVEPPEKVQAVLMGHKYLRERYGSGSSLVQKKSWLDKIAFKM